VTAGTRLREAATLDRGIGLLVLVIAALGPQIFTAYFAHQLLIQTFWYGIAAASLIFLFAFGGMVSLAQVSMYGIAAFVLGNTVTTGEVKGLHLGYDPWVGVVLAVVITTAIGLLLGAVASRSAGIYFLMITLAFSVLANSFFGSVTSLSGFSGISGIQVRTPGLIGNPNVHPDRLYYTALIASVVIYAAIRYVVRTPFGLGLQGIRDDPVRMSSLGYNVALHRTIAFGFAAFVASIAGILYAWQFDHVDPTSIDLSAVIDVLIIAVIGGLLRLEGAWLGAFVFVLLNNYLRSVPGLSHIGITDERFHTVIGVIFLVIVLISPGGLLGIWQSVKGRAGTTFLRPALALGTGSGAPPEPESVDRPPVRQ
jgi:branched-chain amino acid transport system permease protein